MTFLNPKVNITKNHGKKHPSLYEWSVFAITKLMVYNLYIAQ